MKQIDADTFYQLYQSGDLSLVDVRESTEFQEIHLDKARSFPLSRLEESYQDLDPSEHHYLLCKSGIRSQRAAVFLSEKGYQATNVEGGMDALLDHL